MAQPWQGHGICSGKGLRGKLGSILGSLPVEIFICPQVPLWRWVSPGIEGADSLQVWPTPPPVKEDMTGAEAHQEHAPYPPWLYTHLRCNCCGSWSQPPAAGTTGDREPPGPAHSARLARRPCRGHSLWKTHMWGRRVAAHCNAHQCPAGARCGIAQSPNQETTGTLNQGLAGQPQIFGQ